jgi:hypothetical protein
MRCKWLDFEALGSSGTLLLVRVTAFGTLYCSLDMTKKKSPKIRYVTLV